MPCQASIASLLPAMERREVISTSLHRRGALILVRDIGQAAEVANHIAPEHLEFSVADPEDLLGQEIRNAGAIFMGRYTAEALGRLLRRSQSCVADFGYGAILFTLGRLRFPEAFQPDLLLPRGGG